MAAPNVHKELQGSKMIGLRLRFLSKNRGPGRQKKNNCLDKATSQELALEWVPSVSIRACTYPSSMIRRFRLPIVVQIAPAGIRASLLNITISYFNRYFGVDCPSLGMFLWSDAPQSVEGLLDNSRRPGSALALRTIPPSRCFARETRPRCTGTAALNQCCPTHSFRAATAQR